MTAHGVRRAVAARILASDRVTDCFVAILSAYLVLELVLAGRVLVYPALGLLIAVAANTRLARRAARTALADALEARATIATIASRQDAVRALGDRALSGIDTDELLDAAAALVAEQLGVSHAAVFELRPEGDDLLLRAGTGWRAGLVGTETIDAGSGSYGRAVLRSSRTLTGPEADALLAGPSLLRRHGVESGLSAAIGSNGRGFGVLAVYASESRRFTDSDSDFLQLVAGLLTSALRRRRAEDELGESVERLRLALELAHMGTWDDDLVTGKSTWSTSLFALTGVDRASTGAYETFLSLVHPDDREWVTRATSSALAQGRDYELEDVRVCRPDGEVRRFYARGTCLRNGSGRPVRLLGVAHDVTERRRGQEERSRLEDQLRQAQKMEAVGRLAGGIAHDFNNLLLVLRGYGELGLRALSRGDDPRGAIDEMLATAARAGALTRQLLAFSRRQILQPQVLDLNEVILDVGRLLIPLLGEDIESAALPSDRPVCVFADRGQLEQVLANLAVNARDAMPEGGSLTVEVSQVEVGRRHRLPLEPGRYAVLAVSDTGVGMDAETAAQIFEPFFTTKDGLGTGLGLSTVHGIVKQSEGHIWVYSEAGQGTTFKIYLPLAAELADERETPQRVAPDGNGETVLVVEDDAEVRGFVSAMLDDHGYRVVSAGGAEEAELAAAEQARIDLLLTDVVMRGLSGRETAERVKARHPEVKVLYMSGYTDDTVVRRGVLGGETGFLQKPFGSDDLACKVREVLDGARAAASPSAPSGE